VNTPIAVIALCFAAMCAYSAAAGLWVILVPWRYRHQATVFEWGIVLALVSAGLALGIYGFTEFGVLS
jgi:hypothetical protein